MMGGKCSKNKGSESPKMQQNSNNITPPRPTTPSSPPFQMSKNSMLSSHLRSYEAACRSDPSLSSFDADIQQRTVRVLGTLQGGVQVHSLSFDSLKETTNCMLEMDQEVVRVILDNKEDIWKNKDMFSLVEQYFENSTQTLEFCGSLERCLKRAVSNQLVVRAAVSQYDEELETGSVDFDKTLKALARFRAAGDPFTEEFFAMFQSVLAKQYALLERLMGKKRDIDKKLKSLKTWQRVSNVIFVAVFMTVLICTVVAAALTAPPVVTALLGALAVPIGSVGKWCSSLWDRYTKTVKEQREIICSIQAQTFVTLQELENIRVNVGRLEIKIQSLMDNAEFAISEGGSLKVATEEIKTNLKAFTETLEILSQHNNRCIQEVTIARRVIVQRILRQ